MLNILLIYRRAKVGMNYETEIEEHENGDDFRLLRGQRVLCRGWLYRCCRDQESFCATTDRTINACSVVFTARTNRQVTGTSTNSHANVFSET